MTHYFGAGPAALPQSVLQGTADAILDYGGSGISLLEMEHRGKAFAAILAESKVLVRELCGLGDDYEILWLQGGGRLQFCMVPMNFLGEGETAGYIDSGHWAHSAMESARYYGKVEVLASSREANYTHLPAVRNPQSEIRNLSYVHLTTNNTIYGTQFKEAPPLDAPVVADMSSDILGRPRDYRQYAMFYAVAQKNIGAAGVTLVAIRRDFLSKAGRRPLPDMLSYPAQVQADSLLNTPPVAAVYTALLTLRWLKEQGPEAVFANNCAKAGKLYAELERNPLFSPIVEPESRSQMNVVFRAADERTEKAFLDFARGRGILGIAGHRSVGGFRASLYNAVRMESVDYLVSAMQEFEAETRRVPKEDSTNRG